MKAPKWNVRWLFRILDYEHYAVGEGNSYWGQVVVNHADQSLAIVPYPGVDKWWLESNLPKSYAKMRAWLRDHEVPA